MGAGVTALAGRAVREDGHEVAEALLEDEASVSSFLPLAGRAPRGHAVHADARVSR